jgi:hypothetical protein
MIAAGHNEPEVVQALLDAGAMADRRDVRGRSAADHARQNDKLHGTDPGNRLHGAISE